MKTNIHPYYPCKINIYSNGSTYLPNVPLLTKAFTKEQISKLSLPTLLRDKLVSQKNQNENIKKKNSKQDLSFLVLKQKIQEQLKKDYFCIVPLSSSTNSIFNNNNLNKINDKCDNYSYRLINVRFFNKTENNSFENSEILWQEKKDKKF